MNHIRKIVLFFVTVNSFSSFEIAAQLADTPWPVFRQNLQLTGQSPFIGPATPNLSWKFKSSFMRSSPSIGSDGTIYFVQSGQSSSRLFYAINIDGTLQWTLPISASNVADAALFKSSPAIDKDGIIYIATDSYLHAIYNDGTLKWELDITGDETIARTSASPTVGPDGTIYIGTLAGLLYAVNPDGIIKWTFPNGATNSSVAIADDKTLYISGNNVLFAINPTGTLKWSFTMGGSGGTPAIGADGTIHVGAGHNSAGFFYAINPDGTQKWKFDTLGDRTVSSAPAIAEDGSIYFGSDKLYALNPNGSLKWTFDANLFILSSPAVSNDGTIYFGSDDNNVYALNPDGTVKWSFETDGDVYTSPSIGANGTLYVGSNDGNLYAFSNKIDYNVDANNGSDFTGDGTQGNPWKTITFALSQILVPGGNTLHIKAGHYTKDSGESFPILLKNGLSFMGEDSSTTVIDAENTGAIFQGVGITDTSTVIENLTLTRGSANSGSAIEISAGSNITIRNCSFFDNILNASQQGSTVKITNGSSAKIIGCRFSGTRFNGFSSQEIEVDGSTLILKESTIKDNIFQSGQDHVTIACNNSELFAENNLFINNDVRDVLYLLDSQVEVRFNLIVKNLARGIFVSDVAGQIVNNTISDNSGTGILLFFNSPQIFVIKNNIFSFNGGYGISESNTSSDPVSARYNLFHFNSSGLYRDEGTRDFFRADSLNSAVREASDNIDGDPLFVDRLNGSFQLREGSSAIDAGDPASPPDPDDTRVDIGALYFLIGGSPAPPQNLQAQAGAGQVALTWTANTESDFLRYRIYTGTAPNPTTKIDSTEGLLNVSKVVTNLANGVKYYFRVTAVDQALQESDFSNEVSATPTASDLPPDPPQNLQATPGDEQVTLTWDANTESDFLRYRIYGSTSPNPVTPIDSIDGVSNTSKAISGLANGATYYFRLIAVDQAGNVSGFSNEVSVTPIAPDLAPVAPQNLQATPGDGQITLTWNANSEGDFLRYRIFGGTSPNPITQIDSVAGTGNTSKIIQGLINGTTYYYRLKAVDQAFQESGFSNEVYATPTQADVPPAPPANVQAQAGDGQVILTWNANTESDFLRYRIFSGTSANPTVQIDSVDGAANTNKTITGLTNGTTYFFRLRAVDQTFLQSGFSNEVNVTPIAVDNQVPVIIHTPVESAAPEAQNLTISTRVSDAGSGIQTTTLFYRRGGAAAYASVLMSLVSGDTYTGAIPTNAVTVHGLEYYIAAQDNTNNIATVPAINPTANPFVIQVASNNLNFIKTSPASAYRMISIPFDLNNPEPDVVLVDDLGTYDDTQWRFFRYKNDANVEYNSLNFAVDRFAPGIGFWLITRNSTTLDAGAGVSVPTSSNFTITLQPGWNQIGNPFAFAVNWSDVVRGANVENQLVGYQGLSNEQKGYNHTEERLEPFVGYFVNNLSLFPDTIRIPPKLASDGILAPKAASTLFGREVLGNSEWLLQITASAENYLDKDNYLGSLHDAESEHDRNDFSEAPFFADLISLYFPHHDWQDYPGLYTADFQPASDNSQTWDFQVKTNLDNTGVTLALAEIQNLPEGWDVRLLDRKSQIVLDLKQERNYTYLPTADETIRDFRIVVGKGEFVEESDLEITGVPQQFVLQQNYPNPFNPSTVIAFQLPENSRVELAIYAITGRLIRTLIAGEIAAGYHKITWDGRDGSGVRVPSGVYLVWMVAGEKIVAIRKMVLAK